MKKHLLIAFVFFLSFQLNAQQNFKIEPQEPVPGSVIKFEWLTRNTLLQGKQDIEGTAYLLEGKLPLAIPITLKKDGGIVTGTIKTNDSTKAVFFSFSKDDLVENNNDAGYYTILYDNAGKEITGGNLALATGFSSYGGIWRLKRNADKANEFYKKEFENSVAKEKYPSEYLVYLSQLKDEAGKELFKKELEDVANKKDVKDVELQSVKNFYSVNLKDKEKADEVLKKQKELFPDGLWKSREAFDAFYKEKNVYQREKVFEDIRKIPVAEENQQSFEGLISSLAFHFADTADFDNMKKYAGMISNNSMKAGLYNNVAWKQAGEGIHKKPLNLELGKQLSMESLELMKQEMKEKKGKPSYQTDAQYVKNLESDYHNFADTYAVLLYHSGEYDKAYDIQKKAVEHYKRKNANLNTSFTMMIEKTKGKQAAREELEKFFEEGKYTAEMKNQFKAIYLSDNKTENDWVQYTKQLEEKAINRLRGELSKQMINLPAPQFALLDLDGKEVSLASLKGKVLVVDFWATWCGPCIASFPGMKKAIEKYKNHPDVAFIFIDTWETGDDREKKVTDFIEKNKYPFHVLYDKKKSQEGEEFVVVQEYKVDGIPTKFVIDRNSNIRFKSVGWNGNADELVNELTVMIDLAKAESGESLKKTF